MALPDQVSLLCREIKKKGQTEAEEILVRAREQAHHIVRDAEITVQNELEQHLAEKKQQAFQQAGREKDGAMLKARRLILQAREKLTREIFQEAGLQLESMRDNAEYPQLMQSIAVQAIREFPGEDVWIQVRKKDQALVNERFCQDLSRSTGSTVQLLPDPAPITGGCLVYNSDKRVLADFSFAALLKRAEPELRELLSREMLEEQ